MFIGDRQLPPELEKDKFLLVLEILKPAKKIIIYYFPKEGHLRFSGLFPTFEEASEARTQLTNKLGMKFDKDTAPPDYHIVAGSIYNVSPDLIKKFGKKNNIKIIPD